MSLVKHNRTAKPTKNILKTRKKHKKETRLQKVCCSLLRIVYNTEGWLGSRVISVLDSGAEGPGFKSQPRRCPLTVLGKLFTPIVPLFTKQRNW